MGGPAIGRESARSPVAGADQQRAMPTRSSSAPPEEAVGGALDVIDRCPDIEDTGSITCGRGSTERGPENDRDGDPLMTAGALARSQTTWCPGSCPPTTFA